MENWRTIEDFPNYEVSDCGNVRRKGGENLALCTRNSKVVYLRVSLMKGGKCYTRNVHRLVAAAFCEKHNGCNYIDHIDGNKQNNVASNLEWVTAKENKRRARNIGLDDCRGLAHGGKSVMRRIYCVELDKVFNSFAEANEYFGKDKYNSSICACLRTSKGKCWGKHFQYIA